MDRRRPADDCADTPTGYAVTVLLVGTTGTPDCNCCGPRAKSFRARCEARLKSCAEQVRKVRRRVRAVVRRHAVQLSSATPCGCRRRRCWSANVYGGTGHLAT